MSSDWVSIPDGKFCTRRGVRRCLASVVVVVVALIACTACQHTRGRHAGTVGDAGEDAVVRDASADAALSDDRACPHDAAPCASACQEARDCASVTCQLAQCTDARCVYVTLPAGSACGAARVCSQTGACGDCVPGTQRCQPGSSSVLETCEQSGSWHASRCDGQACFNGQCTGECEPGSSVCEGALVRSCSLDGRFAPAVACAAGSCDNGACAAACTPGSTLCAGDLLRTCAQDGRFGSAAPCPSGRCENDVCSAECAPDQAECLDANTWRTCGVDGRWLPGVTCELACLQQACAQCRTGALRCGQDGVEACAADGRWSLQERCSAGCQAERCNACRPSSAVCPAAQDSTQIQRCSADGTWLAAEGCRPHSHCVGGTGDTCPCDPGYRASGLDGDPAAGSCAPE